MKPLAGWLEVLVVAGGLLIAMLVVMSIQQPGAGCSLPFEMPRRLVLGRDTDREHLAADLASAVRIAARYMRAANRPAPHTPTLDCEATLVQEIATRHGLDAGQVRAAGAAAATW